MVSTREWGIKRRLNEGAGYWIERHAGLLSGFIADSRRRGWQKFYDRIRKENSVVHVNDCAGDHDRTRLESRSDAIIGRTSGFIEASSDLEGGVGIITALHGLTGRGYAKKSRHDNVILANVAPREGTGKHYENGTPFCYFFDRRTGALVISTVDGYALSMAKKFKLTDHYYLIDTRKALAVLRASGMLEHTLEEDQEDTTRDTQFRSFEFSPSVAAYLLRYGRIAGTEKKAISDIADTPFGAVWHVDTFAKYGNTKTTLLPEDVFSPEIVKILRHDRDGTYRGKKVTSLQTRFGILPVYRRLKDVPEDGTPAVIVGSSGLDDRRFLEIVIQGGNAGRTLELKIGSTIF